MHDKLKQFGRVKINEPLAKHNTFRIGGRAKFLVIVDDTNKLVGLLNFLSGAGEKYFIVGGGSNLLFSDDEFDGVIIKVQTSKIAIKETMIEAEAGVLLSLAVNMAAQNRLAGLEWGVGIPGTVGGAVRGNAGAMGEDMSCVLDSADVWSDGEILTLKKKECGFGYRDSAFKAGGVVLRARLALRRGDKQEIAAKMAKNAAQRASRISRFASAGSFFKNIKTELWKHEKTEMDEIFHKRGKVPAGWLIEQAGCARLVRGGARVSDEHANIIVNTGEATAKDVLDLVAEIKESVYNKFGVELEEEVEIVR
ncbi:UDP-N-acetylmuramate dehydrogenase [Patescibacteria group bacterium]|nr:MAG: UDP-N-acetylmuramate dehydrogenase [Patescibacteria group bacterium]